MSRIRLGLIGAGISRSSAPRLHVAAGDLAGLDVTYQLRPLENGTPETFEHALVACRDDGFTGVNVTYPYKEMVPTLVTLASDTVAALAAVNTVRFGGAAIGIGYNTDHSGFMRAFERRYPDTAPGAVGMAGAGGVGRPVGFGLAALGATELRIHDRDHGRAARLAADVAAAYPDCAARACTSAAEIADGADGLANCTPIGMWNHPGTAIERALLGRRSWAFDAVYTPLDTQFLIDARDAGLDILSGYELFFYQGMDAFEIFTGATVDESSLRDALAREG